MGIHKTGKCRRLEYIAESCEQSRHIVRHYVRLSVISNLSLMEPLQVISLATDDTNGEVRSTECDKSHVIVLGDRLHIAKR